MAAKTRMWKPNGKPVEASKVFSKIPFFLSCRKC